MIQLTPKQHQIVSLWLADPTLAIPIVAKRIGNTEAATEQHVVKIFKRLNVHSRAELLEKVRTEGMEAVDLRKRHKIKDIPFPLGAL